MALLGLSSCGEDSKPEARTTGRSTSEVVRFQYVAAAYGDEPQQDLTVTYRDGKGREQVVQVGSEWESNVLEGRAPLALEVLAVVDGDDVSVQCEIRLLGSPGRTIAESGASRCRVGTRLPS